MNKYTQLYKKLQDIIDWCEENNMDYPIELDYAMYNLKQDIKQYEEETA